MSVPPLRALAARRLVEQLVVLPPAQLLQYAQTLYQRVLTEGSNQDLYAARAVREELLRRIRTGWKIGIIYHAASGRVERATALLDDPGITRNWMTSKGYYKRDQLFLRHTGLALSRLQGHDLDPSVAEALGDALLQAYAQGQRQVRLNVVLIPGEVIANQQIPSPHTTWQMHVVGVNGTMFFASPTNAEALTVIADLDATPELLSLWQLVQQMDAHPQRMFEW